MRHVRILGIRGLPAAHGGFETFAEHLALYLRDRGWRVTVYCQVDGGASVYEDNWKGIHRVNIPVSVPGPRGTMVFDWRAIVHAARSRDLCLTLGYNTALFCAWLRLRRVPNIVNMDGIEWRRAKWSGAARAWFWLNDWAGCWLGNHLVADHPEIAKHLQTRVPQKKITMIPYGADALVDVSDAPVRAMGLEPGRYLTLIARPEPENSILEVVSGFSSRPRGVQLVVLGNYDKDNAYHRAVKSAAGSEVRFVGAIYDKVVVQALRAHCLAYVHGHQVGGTNPSLVEALGAGNAVLAHDNKFNRWVAGDAAKYFVSASDFSKCVEMIIADASAVSRMAQSAASRFRANFQWDEILDQYERSLLAYAM